MSMVLEDVDFDLFEQEFDGPPQCESWFCREQLGRGTHLAAWWATGPCGDVSAVCEMRKAVCLFHNGWWCSPNGCLSHHEYDGIRFTRISTQR